jgi:hypothetical protein
MRFIKPKMNNIGNKFVERVNTPSDINEHMITLFKYALECDHITECGVRSVVSSYAFAMGLRGKPQNKLIQVDLDWHPNLDTFKNESNAEGVNVTFYRQSDLECPMESTELLFIDTWHVYGHLKRELERWHSSVSKYIIMHDTTVDEWNGESIRCGMNIDEQVKNSGYPREEIAKGLWPAIEEFLQTHSEWRIKERFTNNNGLTVLERVPKIAFITAIYGGYEATCKPFVKQTIPTDFICFTDNPNINANGWKIDTHPYHLTHRAPFDKGEFFNSIENNKHTFTLAKYYKQGFQNIPRLKDYDVIVWVDGTIKIENPNTSQYTYDITLKDKISIFEHNWHRGSLQSEVLLSMSAGCGRYATTNWNNQNQPYQDVVKQYQLYLEDGYTEDHFKKIVPNREHIGVWVTCFVSFLNKDPLVSDFLNLWYQQTLEVSNQEQVSFTYSCYKTNIVPHTYPDENVSGNFENNIFYKKLHHGI